MDAHLRKVQCEKNGTEETEAGNGEAAEADRVRLDGGGYYDTEIYESRGSKYSHYNQSIAVDDNDVCMIPCIYRYVVLYVDCCFI